MGLLIAAVGLLVVFVCLSLFGLPEVEPDALLVPKKGYVAPDSNFVGLWAAPADWRMAQLDPEDRKTINYGKELISHTAEYLGPKGNVRRISNGMNCQNCHLQSGTQPWRNNYFAV